jgi:hypothetical protein
MWRRITRWLAFVPRGNLRCGHLPDPFHAEVLLDGIVVGVLTDRRFVDMFWYSYALEPSDDRVLDDDLWDQCRFIFRDPATGWLCTGAFVGGRRPFVQDGRVLIRAMYFPIVPR